MKTDALVKLTVAWLTHTFLPRLFNELVISASVVEYPSCRYGRDSVSRHAARIPLVW